MCGSCPPGYVGDGTTCLFQGVCGLNNGGCNAFAQCRDNPSIDKYFGRRVLNYRFIFYRNQFNVRGMYLPSWIFWDGHRSIRMYTIPKSKSLRCQSMWTWNMPGNTINRNLHLPLQSTIYRWVMKKLISKSLIREIPGTNCNIRKNSCQPNPCLNGGRCTNIAGFSYTCICANGYTGTNCEDERQGSDCFVILECSN